MSNIKDLTGSRVGKLMLLERKRENSRTYYLCKCECGNEKWIRADRIKVGNCGCERKFKFNDLTNKKFGMLTVLKKVGNTKNNGHLWECKCECGETKNIPISSLISGKTISCGWYQKKKAENNIVKAAKEFKEKNLIDGTNVAYLKRDKLIKSNTSGITGVSFNKRQKLWVAYIGFKGEKNFLGYFKSKEDAIKARKEAEEKLHKEFLRNLK